MKRKTKCLLSILLCVLMGLTPTVTAASVSRDDAVYIHETTPAYGLTYETMYTEVDTPLGLEDQICHIMTWRGGTTLPILSSGKTVFGRKTLSTIAKVAADKGYRVAGGMNADFFSMKTGIPLGIMISEGEVISSDAGANALGLRADGSYIMGKPALSVTLTKEVPPLHMPPETEPVSVEETTSTEETPLPKEPTAPVTVSHINKYPSVWGAYLCTDAYGKTTRSTEEGLELVFMPIPPEETSADDTEGPEVPPAEGETTAPEGTDPATGEATAPKETDPATGETTAPTADEEIGEPDTPAPLSFTVGGTLRARLVEVRENTVNGTIPEGHFVIVVHNKYAKAADYASLAPGDTVSLSVSVSDGWQDVTLAIGCGDILVSEGQVCGDIADEAHEKTANPRTALGYTADGALIAFAVDGRREGSIGMKLDTLASTMQRLGCVGAVNLDGGGSTTVLVRELDGAMIVSNTPSDGGERAVSNALLFIDTAIPDGTPCFAALSPASPIVYKASPVALSAALLDCGMVPVSAAEGEINVVWTAEAGTITEDGIFTPPRDQKGPFTVTAELHLPPTDNTDTQIITASTRVYTTDTVDAISVAPDAITLPRGTQSAPITVTGTWKDHPVVVALSYVQAAFADAAPAEPGTSVLASCADGYLATDGTLWAEPDTERLSLYPTYTLTLSLTTPKGQVRSTRLPVTFGIMPETLFSGPEKDPTALWKTDEGGTLSPVPADEETLSGGVVFSGKALTLSASLSPTHPIKALILYVEGDVPSDLHAVFSVESTESTPTDDTVPTEEDTDHTPTDDTVPSEGNTDHTSADDTTPTEEGTDHTSADDTAPDSTESTVSPETPQSISIPWTVTDDLTRLGGGKRLVLDLTKVWPEGLTTLAPKALLCSDTQMSLTISGLTISYGDTPAVFVDIRDSWAKADILSLYRMGVTNGIQNEDGTYRYAPTSNITRGEFAKMICVLSGLQPVYEAVPAEPLSTAEETGAEEGDAPAVPEKNADLPFTDREALPDWAIPYIRAVVAAGLMRGKTDATGQLFFAPGDTMTRAEVMQVLGGLLADDGALSADAVTASDVTDPVSRFTDAHTVPDWAVERIRRVIAAGLVSGFEDGSLRPLATITRGEIAALFVRTHKTISRQMT